MADIKMPKSIPCRFDEAWKGPCKKPSTNGFCSQHEGKTCVSCGMAAVRSCENACSLICGAPLCDDCCHTFKGDGHGTRTAYQKAFDEFHRGWEETERSRTSPVQRRDKQSNLPVNLFELLKGNWKEEGFHLRNCYLLMLTHGLIGFFPAIIKSSENMVITIDEALLQEVWKTLPPRLSEVHPFIGYVHEEKRIVYMNSQSQMIKHYLL